MFIPVKHAARFRPIQLQLGKPCAEPARSDTYILVDSTVGVKLAERQGKSQSQQEVKTLQDTCPHSGAELWHKRVDADWKGSLDYSRGEDISLTMKKVRTKYSLKHTYYMKNHFRNVD